MSSQYQGYSEVKVGNIPPATLKKALQGKAVRLTKQDLIGDRVMVVHPLNKKAIVKAQKKGSGLTTTFSSGEAMADLNHYNKMGGALEGGSLWSWLQKAGNWLKDSGVGTALADAAVPLATPFLGPAGATAARALLKSTTGVGVGSNPLKGSDEMKAKMAALRAKRKGGSFRIN